MLRNSAKTADLTALGGLMVGTGSLFGRGGAVIGFLLGLAGVEFSYWKSDTLAIRTARAVPDEAQVPDHFASMRDLTDRAQTPMPRLYISMGGVAWRVGARARAHPQPEHPDRVGSRRYRYRDLIRRQHPDMGAISLIQMAVSRCREFKADRTGADLSSGGEPLARALEKLDTNAKRVPMDIAPGSGEPPHRRSPDRPERQLRANRFRTHPSTEERVALLRARHV